MSDQNRTATRTWVIEERIQTRVELPDTITTSDDAERYIMDRDVAYLERSEVLGRDVYPETPVKSPYNVDTLPAYMRDAVLGYLEYGWELRGFLYAIFTNDLVAAYVKADYTNRAAMYEWTSWLYNDCPRMAWGDATTVRAWQEARRAYQEENRATR